MFSVLAARSINAAGHIGHRHKDGEDGIIHCRVFSSFKLIFITLESRTFEVIIETTHPPFERLAPCQKI